MDGEKLLSYRPMVCKLGMRSGIPYSDIDDLFGEVVVSVLSSKTQEPNEPRRWIWTIAKHACTDYFIRKKTKKRGGGRKSVELDPDCKAHDVDREAERVDLNDAIAALSLSTRQQQLVDLYMQGLNSIEIGELLGVHHSSIRQRLSLIVRKLREIW